RELPSRGARDARSDRRRAPVGGRGDELCRPRDGSAPRAPSGRASPARPAPGRFLVSLPEHVRRNRAHWDAWARDYEEPGRHNWASDEPSWGIFGVPESEVGMLSAELDGLDAIELGCGTGYVSA